MVSASRREVLWLVTLALVAGCAGAPPEPVRIGLTPWPPNDLYALAERLGAYEGLGIHVADFAAAEQGLRAFRNAAIEAVPCTLDEALRLAVDTDGLRIVQVLDASDGADVILARPEISSMHALGGRRIGYEATALGAYVLGRALATEGMVAADVVLVPVPVDDHRAALESGRVDAVVTYAPVAEDLLQAGYRKVFDSTRIPGEILDVLVVRVGTLERRLPAVSRLVTGWLQAADLLGSRSEVATAFLAARLGRTPAAVPHAFAGIRLYGAADNLRLLEGPGPALVPVARRMAQTMLDMGLLRALPPFDALVDARAIPRG